MSAGEVPDIAVLIPALNESESIRRCLGHVLDQDVPRDRLEVVVIDGDSTDDTAEIAEAVLAEAQVGRWQVHRNSGGSTPSNLNCGLALVRSPVVCRVDARSLIPPDYVRRCQELLDSRSDVAVVGGTQVAVARSDSSHDRGVARALNNRYAMGFSRYRRRAPSGPSDTVYLGAFRTAQLRGIGGWDERFATNQDFELNRRMALHGTVWFDASMEVGYLPRESVPDLFRQYRRFGAWKARYWELTGDAPQLRQRVLLVMPATAAGTAAIALVPRGHRLARLGGLVVAGAVALAAVDHVGSEGSSEVLSDRGWAIAAIAAVGSGWLSGVLEGSLRR